MNFRAERNYPCSSAQCKGSQGTCTSPPPFQSDFLFITKLGQGNVFTGVCDSVHRGVCASVHAGMPAPPDQADTPQTRQTPPGQADTPLDQRPTPQTRQIPPDQADPPGIGSPPGPETHPPEKQTPAYGQWAAGTHPTGMHSCFNAFSAKIVPNNNIGKSWICRCIHWS